MIPANYTSDNLIAVNSSLVDLQVKLAAGFDGWVNKFIYYENNMHRSKLKF